MFLLKCDESVAFDVLSILGVKLLHCQDSDKYKQLLKQYEELKNDLIQQVGEIKFTQVLNSLEYTNLFQVNIAIFQGVDQAKLRQIDGYDLDMLNCKRFVAKKELQNSFFNNPLAEIKLYE